MGDDRVIVSLAGGRLRVAAPETIRGKLEVRGMGIVTVPYVASADLALVVELVAPGTVERLPDPLPTRGLYGRQRPAAAAGPVRGRGTR